MEGDRVEGVALQVLPASHHQVGVADERGRSLLGEDLLAALIVVDPGLLVLLSEGAGDQLVILFVAELKEVLGVGGLKAAQHSVGVQLPVRPTMVASYWALP